MTEFDKPFLLPANAPDEPGAASRAGHSEIVDGFSRVARIAESRERLRQAFSEVVAALGFDYFALQGEDARLLIADMPAHWIFRPDPERDLVFAAASRSLTPFLWSDIPRLTALSPADARLVQAAPAGLAVPIRGPGFAAAGQSGLCGCCSFLVRKGAALPVENFAAAHYIGALALDAATRLDRAQPARPRLTPRQRDCMVLAAQGKSDWEIGRLLGISESTVHKHVEDAKRRFGVSTRIQLVVRSLADARLSFSDILGETFRR